MKYTLAPWGIRWEQPLTKTQLAEREKPSVFVKFNLEGLLRGDYVSRMNGYAVARRNGWMSTNDILALENLDRIAAADGSDLYLVNGNMRPLFMAGAYATAQQAQQDVAPTEEQPPVEQRVERRNR